MKDYKLTQGSSLIIDLIRGISAQLVVVGHGISFLGVFTFLQKPNFPCIQSIAVLIFFLLSGFLISYSTIRKKKKDDNYSFKHYFADRFSRIYTTFIPAIIFVLIIDLLSMYLNSDAYLYSTSFNLKTFISNLFMLQDYPVYFLSPKNFGSGRVFWTLAIEWWIYLFFGYLLLVFCKKNKMNLSNLLILLFLSIVPLFNLVAGRGNALTTYWIYGSVVYLASTLNILNLISRNIKILFVIVLSGLAGIREFYLLFTIKTFKIDIISYDPIFAFLLAMILWLTIDLFKETIFSKKPTQLIHFLASYSYTLYLVHYSIFAFIHAHYSKTENPYLLLFAGFVISNIISIGIGRYTEIGLTRKVKLFIYKKIE